MAVSDLEVVRRAARWAGLPWTDRAAELLVRYAAWLVDEAVPGGGLGPGEGSRVWSRHLADAVTFGIGFDSARPEARLADVGSGVGLPGIPLAILMPGWSVMLLDRSGRRTALARRALRILDLPNAQVKQGSAESEPGKFSGVTMRAVAAPDAALALAWRLLEPHGVAIIGLSHGATTAPPAPGHEAVELIAVPEPVLDSPAWLLRMTAPADR